MTPAAFERAPSYLVLRAALPVIVVWLAAAASLRQEITLSVGSGMLLMVLAGIFAFASAVCDCAIRFDSRGMFRFSRTLLTWNDVKSARFGPDVLVFRVRGPDGRLFRVHVPLTQFKDRRAVLLQIGSWLSSSPDPRGVR